MCGRFAQAVPLGKLKKIDLFGEISEQIPFNYNVAPGETVSIIIRKENNTILQSKWGFVNNKMKTGNQLKPFINAKSETVAEKKYFRDAFNNTRCIIPVNGFYEWKTTDKKRDPFFFFYGDDPGESLIFLAGIYNINNQIKSDITFAVLTTGSIIPVNRIHERMPVLIRPEKIQVWLDNTPLSEELLNPINNAGCVPLNMVPVTPGVNNARYKSVDCILPLDV